MPRDYMMSTDGRFYAWEQDRKYRLWHVYRTVGWDRSPQRVAEICGSRPLVQDVLESYAKRRHGVKQHDCIDHARKNTTRSSIECLEIAARKKTKK